MRPVFVRLEGVGRIYRRGRRPPVRALDGIDLEIGRGERLAVVGRSGSGKSTLLQLLAGLERPTSGRILVDGEDLATADERALVRHRRERVGQVFQEFHLLDHLNVLENVLVPAWIAGDREEEARRRAASLLERVGLGGRFDDAVDTLSGGERQRVALARALVRRQTLLLADEPTGALDDETSAAVAELLFEVAREQGAALVVATHDADLASRADRVVRLHSGRLDPPS